MLEVWPCHGSERHGQLKACSAGTGILFAISHAFHLLLALLHTVCPRCHCS